MHTNHTIANTMPRIKIKNVPVDFNTKSVQMVEKLGHMFQQESVQAQQVYLRAANEQEIRYGFSL